MHAGCYKVTAATAAPCRAGKKGQPLIRDVHLNRLRGSFSLISRQRIDVRGNQIPTTPRDATKLDRTPPSTGLTTLLELRTFVSLVVCQ